MRGKGCDYDLMALRSTNSANEDIHVYAHSQHTHPIVPEGMWTFFDPRSKLAKQIT
jgi:hypothetical protein